MICNHAFSQIIAEHNYVITNAIACNYYGKTSYRGYPKELDQ